MEGLKATKGPPSPGKIMKGAGLKAGSPPWGPPAAGRGTAGWPGPPGGRGRCPRLPPRSSARSGRRPSGRSLGCRGSAGTRSCRGLKIKTDQSDIESQIAWKGTEVHCCRFTITDYVMVLMLNLQPDHFYVLPLRIKQHLCVQCILHQTTSPRSLNPAGLELMKPK